MRDLTLEGKIIVFKTLALSDIFHLCITSVVPKQIIKEVKNIQKSFLPNQSTPKIIHSTLCNLFAASGLRKVGMNTKIASLQCSWTKLWYDDSFHEWELIPFHLINIAMMMMNCFCGMVERRRTISLISSRDHCQRSSPSRISDTSRAGFEPAQNQSSGLVERSCAVVITTTPWCQYHSYT